MHFGKITFDVDERGEVAMLTRNIKLQASADAEQSFYGGHVMAMVAKQDVCRGRRIQSNGPEPDSRPISDPLASDRRRTGAVHQERRRSMTPTTAV